LVTPALQSVAHLRKMGPMANFKCALFPLI